MTQEQALYKYCLRMGDDALIHSYRLSEWCSNAPILEEDLALTNFSLDMIGRAQAILDYAGKVDGNGNTSDDLAYRRKERGFYNHLIVELPNGDFAYTMARILCVSVFEYYFFSELCHSADNTLAAIAAKTVKEVKYHMAHATDWALRLGDGTDESNTRMQQAVDELWAYTGELFETDAATAILEDRNIAVDMGMIRTKWENDITRILTEAKLSVPAEGYNQTGSSNGVHTEYLGHILSEMQYLQRAYPEAIW